MREGESLGDKGRVVYCVADSVGTVEGWRANEIIACMYVVGLRTIMGKSFLSLQPDPGNQDIITQGPSNP
jgi:hypothetical protein